jgi:dTDP-4-dehydrorhamnose reductase
MDKPLIIGRGLVGGALAAALPNARVLARPEFDLRNEGAWPDISGHDAAFFCAAIPRMADCENDAAGTAFINVTQTIRLLEKLVAQGTWCLFLSTDKVFDGTLPHIAPDAATNPQCEYGRQKVAVEQWCATQKNTCVLRLSKVLPPKLALLDQWQMQWSQGNAVEVFEDMTLAPVWLVDVVEAMTTLANERRDGIQQISGAEDISYADFARRIAPKNAQITPISYRDKQIPAYQAPLYTSYHVTVGVPRTADEVISLWRKS